jgi:ABC-type antimicrobial peptide transport system permease subunit
LGSVLAVIVIGPMGAVLARFVPEVAVDFSYATALRLSAVMLIVAAAAALIPASYIIKVDPALVFKG